MHSDLCLVCRRLCNDTRILPLCVSDALRLPCLHLRVWVHRWHELIERQIRTVALRRLRRGEWIIDRKKRKCG